MLTITATIHHGDHRATYTTTVEDHRALAAWQASTGDTYFPTVDAVEKAARVWIALTTTGTAHHGWVTYSVVEDQPTTDAAPVRYILDTTEATDHADHLTIPAHGATPDDGHGVWTVHVTADDFARFIAQWQAVDPNGAWGETLTEDDGMHYRAADASEGDDDEHFPRVGSLSDGTPLYAVDWTFIPAPTHDDDMHRAGEYDECAACRVYGIPADEHANYPHTPGTLYDCRACEGMCHCTPGAVECVYGGTHNGTATD